jgi:hypothetical protein
MMKRKKQECKSKMQMIQVMTKTTLYNQENSFDVFTIFVNSNDTTKQRLGELELSRILLSFPVNYVDFLFSVYNTPKK